MKMLIKHDCSETSYCLREAKWKKGGEYAERVRKLRIDWAGLYLKAMNEHPFLS